MFSLVMGGAVVGVAPMLAVGSSGVPAAEVGVELLTA